MVIEEILIKRIKEARESCGLTQEGLADKLKVSQVTVARWENGERQMPLKTLEAIANATKHEVYWFLKPYDSPSPIEKQENSDLLSRIKNLNSEGLQRLNDYIDLLLLKFKR